MYHYVRDLKNSRYPQIKGLDRDLFIEQVEYLMRYYNFVTMEQVIAANRDAFQLPEKAILLTFDDGYLDHFNVVYPILKNRGIQGSFFAPIKAITENTVLDVNKIHFILASCDNEQIIIAELKRLLDKYRGSYNLNSFDYYYDKLAQKNRFDGADVIFIKRLLQVELTLEVRRLIVDELFLKIVGVEENSFSRELYVNEEQMKCMVEGGMHIGSHGFDHFWLGSLSYEQQKIEIEKSVEFIKKIYGNKFSDWTICFPYGNYNEDTLKLLEEYNCAAGFTTEVRIANISNDNIFTIPRLDTNDIPKDRNAEVNEWYKLA